MFDPKFTETCMRRFAERDVTFMKAMQGVFEEMSARGVVASGLTAGRGQEVVQEELKASGDEILKVLMDIHAVYGRKIMPEAVKLRSHGILQQRLQEIETFIISRLEKMLGHVASQRVLYAVDLQEQLARVTAEFDLRVDRYFHDVEQVKGKNLKERIVNAFHDRPIIALIAVIFAAMAAIAGFVAALRSLQLW
jgi:hypothetical protein